MCGVIGGRLPLSRVEQALPSIRHRGPDAEGVAEQDGWAVGHTRLAIIDLSDASTQPMRRGGTLVVFNGELWNYQQLRDDLAAGGREFITVGDTEVVAVALDEWDPVEALRRMNGMLAVAWIDPAGVLHLARDRFGEVPLHYGWTRDRRFVFASELRPLLDLGAVPATVRWVPPSVVLTVTPAGDVTAVDYDGMDLTPLDVDRDEAAVEVRRLLAEAVAERSIGDVPAATLLSGGIDSAAVTALLAEHTPGIRAYTAVHNPRSRDRVCARATADQLGVELVEVPVPAPTADDLAHVVNVIEQPSKAQTEIAWACLHLARRLADDGVKVVFTGEGSDELWASYANSYHGIRQKGWHRYRHDVFYGQHRKNFPRCNKVFMSAGIEARLPFLHPNLVRYALRLPQTAVEGPNPFKPHTKPNQPKMVLRQAFLGAVPDDVIARNKEAFQTGAGLDTAAAAAVTDPARYYRAVFKHAFQGVAP